MTELNEAKISYILGIDYGASKVGLALGDFETKMAFSYGTLDNDENMLQKLAEIIEKENASKVIIGVPNHINRKQVVYPGEKLGEFLENKLKIEVEYENEMFTTKMAEQGLIERGVKGIKKHDDEEAARIILQSWLDKNG
jgi:putative transcription antitermination factor YqgF